MNSIEPPVSHVESLQGEKVHALLNICQKINSEKDLATVLDLIAREATNLMEADRSSIFLLDRLTRHDHSPRDPQARIKLDGLAPQSYL